MVEALVRPLEVKVRPITVNPERLRGKSVNLTGLKGGSIELTETQRGLMRRYLKERGRKAYLISSKAKGKSFEVKIPGLGYFNINENYLVRNRKGFEVGHCHAAGEKGAIVAYINKRPRVSR